VRGNPHRCRFAVNTICVVQARMGSTRLPGKVLADVGGMPMLAFLLRRLRPLRVDGVVIATTEAAADDDVASLARDEGAAVVRGPDTDVLARFVLALDRFPASTVVRITADCPFTDPALVGTALAVRDATGADYVSNTLVRTFPDGLDIEVIDADALRIAAAEADDPVEREHVTPFVYRHPERFTLRTLRYPQQLGDLRWTVDTGADLAFVRDVVEHIGHGVFSWQEVLALDTRPRHEAAMLLPAQPADETALLDLRNDRDSVRWSRSNRRVDAPEHAAWFANVLENPATRVWVARRDERTVGEVRIDVRYGTGTVSIAVAPEHRGHGLGTELLRELVRALRADEQVHTLVAEIHRDNVASQRAFARAGFSEQGADGDFVRYEVVITAVTSRTTRGT
jgi:spore coat polysaccharide biosynthesis protein SpsF